MRFPRNTANLFITLTGTSPSPVFLIRTRSKFSLVDTAQIGLKVLLANGGEVVSRSGKLVLRIPQQDPVPPSNLEQVKWDGDKPVF
jgi:hypothetical protein